MRARGPPAGWSPTGPRAAEAAGSEGPQRPTCALAAQILNNRESIEAILNAKIVSDSARGRADAAALSPQFAPHGADAPAFAVLVFMEGPW